MKIYMRVYLQFLAFGATVQDLRNLCIPRVYGEFVRCRVHWKHLTNGFNRLESGTAHENNAPNLH